MKIPIEINDRYSSMLNRVKIVEKLPTILTADYEVGFKERYFVKNKIHSFILEVDKDTYNGISNMNVGYPSELYDTLKLTWKLFGPYNDITSGNATIYGVFDTNFRTVKKAQEKMKGIQLKLRNLTQFAKITRPV